MSYLKGTDVNLGIGRESTRGTYQAPSVWVPARTPTGVHQVVEKAQIRETTGTGIATTGSVVVQKRTEGDLEFNVRSSSIGYILLSLLGSVTTSTLATGVYQHIFNILTGTPQFPTLSLGLAQLGQQDYKYVRTAVSQLELRCVVDDLVNATASFIGADESTVSDYTTSFASTDYYFRPYDVSVKFASAVGGLGAATATKVKELSLTINNNARINQNISEVTPSEVFALLHEISGSVSLDYDAETYHDTYASGGFQAMQITLSRSDVDLGTSNPPSITIVMPKVSLESRDPDRPIDDIVVDNFDFMAHYDTTAGYGIRATVVNGYAAYTT